MNELLKKAEEELSQVEELLEVEFCDDGLVFYHLQNAVSFLLKALAEEYKVQIKEEDGILDIIGKLKEKTTIKFPEWIDQIIELEDISSSDGCGATICYDMDMYGDIIYAVYQLKEFVKSQVER
ncbi:HEPN domain-containing protein [Persephonella sp.]|uniref:HEPN domain-containing protein n=1 Tax=Persephonella sp. TaxID=2060922 RepID=UPI0025D86ACA|nr:HEPN domain-containing protein [Persephonella sp.]